MNNCRKMSSQLSVTIKKPKKKKVTLEIIGKTVGKNPETFFVALYKFTVCPCLEDYLKRIC